MAKRLVILYDGPPDLDLEEELKVTIVKHGWTWYAQGSDLFDNERDISFYREDDEE